MSELPELPFLTADVPGIGGRIKAAPSDFRVDEVPLYEPSGEGTHVYFRIEKVGLPTMQAVHEIARALGRPDHDIGYAGLKDADAVTSQMLSLEHVDEAKIETLQLPRIKVLSFSRHTNKLKLGHLKGNRFVIRVRDVDPGRADDVRAMMAVLVRRGVPNYFGPQRFGSRGDTWRIGRALLRQDYDEAVALMLGQASDADTGEVRRARELFDAGQYAAAATAWPYPFRNERRLCQQLAKSKGNVRRAFGAVDKPLRRLFVAAYQSHLFNLVVARRIGALDQLQPGDLAWRHPQGAVFRVEDLAREQARCDAFEISPTGPLFGYRMTEPAGPAAELEHAILAAENLPPDVWRAAGQHKVKGGRRPLRFQPHEAAVETGLDERGPYLQLAFFLEAGCYATTLLREIMKRSLCDPGSK